MGLSVLLVGFLGACGGDDQTVTSPEETTHVQQKGDLVATIRASARAASPDLRITSVDCTKPVDTADVFLLSCAVTFEGPACQLWLASGIDDPEPSAFSDTSTGRRGRADERMAYCDG
jgi:hypothetical protein